MTYNSSLTIAFSRIQYSQTTTPQQNQQKEQTSTTIIEAIAKQTLNRPQSNTSSQILTQAQLHFKVSPIYQTFNHCNPNLVNEPDPRYRQNPQQTLTAIAKHLSMQRQFEYSRAPKLGAGYFYNERSRQMNALENKFQKFSKTRTEHKKILLGRRKIDSSKLLNPQSPLFCHLLTYRFPEEKNLKTYQTNDPIEIEIMIRDFWTQIYQENEQFQSPLLEYFEKLRQSRMAAMQQ